MLISKETSISPLPCNVLPNDHVSIKTSKKWVLPPRPKPGRKPMDSIETDDENNKIKLKRGRKSNLDKSNKNELTINPIKQLILKINEENYYLKLEVIKLVSDLKSLKSDNLNEFEISSIGEDSKELKQEKEISSIPMDYNSSSNQLINNNTVYQLQSPLLSPSTTPPLISNQKKRPHNDDEINDLILSLIDLNHTNEISPLTSSNLNSLHSEQIIEATVKKLNDKKRQQQNLNKNFKCENFLNIDLDDDKNISSSPHNDFIEDTESIDIDSLTPNSLLSLTKTNSTIDEFELDHHHQQQQHFTPELIDIPETVNLQENLNYEFSFWKDDTVNENLNNKKIKNFVFNTNSTLDELIMERQREREKELLNYNEFNDMINFENENENENENLNDDENIKNQNNVIFNDDWRLDENNLLNF